MFALLGQRSFFLLWIAHTVSIVGDYVFFIVITFWIYEQTSSALATGAVLITSTVPAFLVAGIANFINDQDVWMDIAPQASTPGLELGARFEPDSSPIRARPPVGTTC